MTGSGISDVDRRILAALQLNGRAPWQAIARSVGVNESTAQRRYQALAVAGAARVIGVTDVLRCGLGIPVLVRISTRPGQALAVAEKFAATAETRFAAVLTGSVDVVAELVLPTDQDLSRLLVHGLPAIDSIRSTETFTVIRTFTSAHDWDPGILGSEATALLRPDPRQPFEDRVWAEPPEPLDQVELAIAAVLAEDGRLPARRIAEAVGKSESTVARRMESMMRRGCLRFRTVVEPHLLGFDVEFMLWVDVEPASLERAGRLLARAPSTKYLSATTGRFNLCAQISLESIADLYPFTTDVVGRLPGVRDAETTLQVETLKRAWTPVGPTHVVKEHKQR